MRLNIKQTSKKTLSVSETRKLVRSLASSMMSARLIKHLSLTIIFYDTDKGYPYADCGWEDTNYRPRKFSIVVSPRLSRKQQISSIVHEMVHVRQFAKGELMDYMNHRYDKYTKWKNKLISIKVPYRKRPWEIEAYRLEKKLYKQYVRLLEK